MDDPRFNAIFNEEFDDVYDNVMNRIVDHINYPSCDWCSDVVNVGSTTWEYVD